MRWIWLLAPLAACSPYRQFETTQLPTNQVIDVYVCANGRKVEVIYDNSEAESVAYVRVVGKSEFMRMALTPAASGARYATGTEGFVWWTKGDEGFLEKATPDWDGKVLLRDCQTAPATE